MINTLPKSHLLGKGCVIATPDLQTYIGQEINTYVMGRVESRELEQRYLILVFKVELATGAWPNQACTIPPCLNDKTVHRLEKEEPLSPLNLCTKDSLTLSSPLPMSAGRYAYLCSPDVSVLGLGQQGQAESVYQGNTKPDLRGGKPIFRRPYVTRVLCFELL